jgi:hypothetical protein
MSSPWQTRVNVTLKSVDHATGTGEFVLDPVGVGLPPPTGPHQVLTFENNYHNGFDIDFVLIDKTKQGYSFPPNSEKTEAVSSQMGATNLCPPQGTSEVLQPINVHQTNSPDDTLRVHNKNQGSVVGDFGYALWVTNDGGSSYIKLDPGGHNNNGMTAGFSKTAALVVTVAVAAVAAFALYKLRVFQM